MAKSGARARPKNLEIRSGRSRNGELKRLNKIPEDLKYKIFTISSGPFVALILKMVHHQSRTEQNLFSLRTGTAIFDNNNTNSIRKLYSESIIDTPLSEFFYCIGSFRINFSSKKSAQIHLAEQVI
jgi:hypothetical protein